MPMGNKDQKISRAGVTPVIGRVMVSAADRNPETGIAEPFLLLKDGTVKFSVRPVIALLLSHPEACNEEIVSKVAQPGLRPIDVAMVRIYMHRFGCDVLNPAPLPKDGKIFLLDQNIPPEAVLRISRAFGWSAHVQTEGLAGKNMPDDLIWDYAAEHNFAGIVTGDTDFLGIQRRRFEKTYESEGAAPSLVFVDKSIAHSDLCTVFEAQAAGIRAVVREGSYGCHISHGMIRTL